MHQNSLRKIVYTVIYAIAVIAMLAYLAVKYAASLTVVIIALAFIVISLWLLIDFANRSTLKLDRMIDSDERTPRQLILLSVYSMLPMYFCYAIASFVPVLYGAVWFITVFPLIIFLCVPLFTIAGELKRTHINKAIFWGVHISILILIYAVFQSISRFLLSAIFR